MLAGVERDMYVLLDINKIIGVEREHKPRPALTGIWTIVSQ